MVGPTSWEGEWGNCWSKLCFRDENIFTLPQISVYRGSNLLHLLELLLEKQSGTRNLNKEKSTTRTPRFLGLRLRSSLIPTNPACACEFLLHLPMNSSEFLCCTCSDLGIINNFSELFQTIR
jgi:hypothetical protein